MKFLDLFAGIGGFRLGMEAAGHTCVGFAEIDKFARASYKAIHDTKGEFEFHDITAVTDELVRGIGRVDVICGGFPCQAFSVAGKRAGFEDTRGTLFFEIARFASILRPKYLFLENVTGLLSHDNGNTFETILGALDELGYDAEWQVFNSKNFGVPQNRERVFIIGHLRGTGGRAIFPFRGESEKSTNELKIDIIGNTKNPQNKSQGTREVVHSSRGIVGALTATDYKGPKQVAIPVLTPDREEKRQNGRRFKTDGEPMFTLTAQDKHGVVVNGIYTGTSENFKRPPLKNISRTLKANNHDAGIVFESDGIHIRKLTPRECWRLQGFPDWAFDKASKVNSDSQLYKQAGNSVTVNVIAEIAKRL